MKILEFGDTSKRKIILIHGFQCPWQVWNKYIAIIEQILKIAQSYPASFSTSSKDIPWRMD